MIEKLNQILRGLIERVKDSGWKDLTLSTYNKIWDVRIAARGRRIGNLVILQFEDVRATGDVISENVLVNELPEEFRPDVTSSFLFEATPSAGIRVGGLLTVYSSGRVVIAPCGGDRWEPTYGIRANAVYFVGGGVL